MRLNDLSCRSYFAIRHTDDREIPISRWISRAVLWLCGGSSWLQIKSATVAMFCAIRVDRKRPLPRRLSVTPVASISDSSLSKLALLHAVWGNSHISLRELHCFASRKPFIMIESSLVILPILSQYLKKRYLKLLTSCLQLTKTVNDVCVTSLNAAYVSIIVSKPLGLSFSLV